MTAYLSRHDTIRIPRPTLTPPGGNLRPAVRAASPLPVRWSPRPLRTLARRIARSRYETASLIDDLRAAAASTFWPAVVGSGLLLGAVITLLIATRGQAWIGGDWQSIPTGAR